MLVLITVFIFMVTYRIKCDLHQDLKNRINANDNVLLEINAYLCGLYGEVGSEDAVNTLIKNIEIEKLRRQIIIFNSIK